MRGQHLRLPWFKSHWVGLVSGVVLAALGSTLVQAADDTTELDALLERVSAEVELLRYQMGKPENTQGPPAVDDAQPHEVFLQAQNLFRKANRLARELVGAPRQSPPVAGHTGDIVVADIYDPLQAALAQILSIKSELGITAEVESPRGILSGDLTRVYRAAVQINRQLNLLTESTFSASDVYGQISLAITYAGGILSAFPEADPMPEPPPFEAGKSPDDVYRQLSDCMRLNRSIANEVQFEILRYDPRGFRRSEALPSDVYDLATLLVSYVGHVGTQLEAPEIYPEIVEPDYVFYSHAYQQAGILHQQLTHILEQVEN